MIKYKYPDFILPQFIHILHVFIFFFIHFIQNIRSSPRGKKAPPGIAATTMLPKWGSSQDSRLSLDLIVP